MSEFKFWQSNSECLPSAAEGQASPHLRQPAMYRVSLAQLAATLLLPLTLLPVSATAAVSALMGGICCSLPNAFLVWKAFRYRGARAAKQIATAFYQGEAGKFILTIVAFVLVFTLVKPIEPLALFGAFAVVQSIHWFTPLLIKI